MTQEEALRMALEALERSVATCFDQRSHYEVMGRPEHFVNKAITALRLAIDVQNMASESTYKDALAQTQEPVAWTDHGVVNWIADKQFKHASLLYTTPPQRTWVGLTDEEIKAFDTWHDNREEEVGWCNPSEIVAYIEAKLKDKNT